ASGPPTPKPIDIEVSGDNFEDLVSTSTQLKHYLDSLQIGGIEDLRSDLENHKPQIVFDIDRERANREGISTAQIGMEIRDAVFGKEVSKFRAANDEYPIELRYERDQRDNIDALNNLKITYRDMNMGGKIRQVPMSAFVKIHYSSSYGGIKRKNNKPLISLTSNVLSGYNANKVVADIQTAITSFKAPDGVQIKMGGEQEDQKETASFLGHAMLISLMLIFLILVTQFNSISKPFIILSEIVFSLIGVMLGFSIFKMDMSIVMTGVGFIALAGIVVRNGILLVEFTDLLREQGYNTMDAIIEAAKTRMTPVILTACATILGLIPLAIGFNIDFVTMFTELNPHIYFGGDSVAFWGPLSWTMIFGLSFATVITLIVVPVMYLLADNAKIKSKKLIEEFSATK
ncbi:MAG TPA: efflux RND transporter permease subunit, partial [Bacteroidia bacterium]|nr:efflux RND transporter permease subunit [Bacteroidia bacterium]